MKLWTVWTDYFATGEGRTLMARIAYAENEQDALAGFGREFDPYFAIGADALEGVQENDVTQFLFSPAVFEGAREMEDRAQLIISARFHFNLS